MPKGETPNPMGQPYSDEAFRKSTQEWDRETGDRKRQLRELLFQADDLLKDGPASFPYRDEIRALMSAAGQLNNRTDNLGVPGPMTHGKSQEDLHLAVRDRVNRALGPLGFELTEVDPDKTIGYDYKKNPVLPGEWMYDDPRFDDLPHDPPKK